jgi:hypothetical protein
MVFNRNLNVSGNQNLTDADKGKEILNVNFELGNEVWDDFDDENLIEATIFSTDTEKTKIPGKAVFQHEVISLEILQIFFILAPATNFLCLFMCVCLIRFGM